jgi:hypothetical protein
MYSVISLSQKYENKGFWCLSMGTGTKEDESSTGNVRADGFHHVMASSRLACILKPINCLFV